VKLAAGFACLSLASILLPPVRERLEDREPPTKFGRTTTVDERFISDTDRACSVCLDRIESGVVREYEETFLFAGVPLFTADHGENLYCESCREDIHGFNDSEAQSNIGASTDSATAGTPTDARETASTSTDATDNDETATTDREPARES
jgi:hypothetical protein